MNNKTTKSLFSLPSFSSLAPLRLCEIFSLCLLLLSVPISSALAQESPLEVNIIQAPTNYVFVDMGYDIENDEIAIVGNVINGAENIPTVFELNANQDAFTTQTLADLPGATSRANVLGISADAIRIAGSSSSENSSNNEGTTWLRSNPSEPTSIGFVNGFINNSSAIGAWANGIVGNSGGLQRPIIWDIQDGIQILPGTEGGLAEAQDISINGEISVGFSTHEVFGGAAYYWDNNGINRLNDTVQGFTTINSVARNISPNGNFIAGDIVLQDGIGNTLLVPAVWEGPQRTLRVLTDSNGDFIQGAVSDVSNLGITVGTFFDASFNSFGFIENPEFTNGVEVFEDWLETVSPGTNFPFSSLNVGAIAAGNGKLFFTVGSNLGEFALVDVSIGSDLGDVNQDSVVDFSDIPPFIAVLQAGEFQMEADTDQNGVVNFSDIPEFITILQNQ